MDPPEARWYAGASLELETNKGRVIGFHPHLATRCLLVLVVVIVGVMVVTRQKDQEVTMVARPGHEIIMLRIK